jgi:cytoskeleton protein RodZ
VPATFGERLKKEREKRGMTLEEVSGVTKISVRNLRALETEKFEQMPGGIFNRGFVRSYAKHLGLDEEQVVADYLEASGESLPSRGPLEGPVDTGAEAVEQEMPPAEFPWAILAVVLLLVALFLAGWYYSRHRDRHDAAETLPEPASALAPAEAPQATPPTVAGGSASGQETSGAVAVAPAKAGFDVLLQASDEVWLSSAVDGQAPAESTLVKGQSLTVHGADKVVLRVGNAAVVTVVFNGQRVPMTGSEGEVRTLIFTSSGLQPQDPTIAKPN